MLNITTNLSSIITQRSLSKSTQLLNQAIERMSTGYKLNHARDNAANYSISTNLTTKLGAYQIAEDNAAMGLDMLTTANDSLNLISDHLVRIRALAEQAANGTYGAQSLEAINSEVNARVDEIERLYSTAEYNGINFSSAKAMSKVDSSSKLKSGNYAVSTAEDLAKLAEMTNNGLIGSDCVFVQTGDIDLSGMEWTPIGKDKDAAFEAFFDGNGYTISNLFINNPDLDYAGVFGCVYGSGSLSNINVDNANVYGGQCVGGLVGYVKALGTDNCSVTNSQVRAKISHVGGLAGVSGSSVTNCSVSDVHVYVETSERIGGFIGESGGENTIIKSCVAQGGSVNILKSDNSGAGGFIGVCHVSLMEDCYVNTEINSNNSHVAAFVGGLYFNYEIDRSIEIKNCNVQSTFANAIGHVFASVVYRKNPDIELKVNIADCVYNSANFSEESKYIRGILGMDGDNVNLSNITDKVEPQAPSDWGVKHFKSRSVELSDGETSFQVGIDSDASSQINLDLNFLPLNVSALRLIGLNNIDYLSKIDEILFKIDSKQIEYGAAQNRLESALDEISTQYENILSSRSTLKDADIAKVSSQYIQQQILQQASATLMSTANQTPALALQLL